MEPDQVRRALRSLDAKNDDHWTAQGLARVDLVGQLLGAPISREQIAEVAPDFTRDNTVLEEPALAAPAMPRDPKAEARATPDAAAAAETYLELSGQLTALYDERNKISDEIKALEAEQAKLARYAPNPKRRSAAEDTRQRMAVIRARSEERQRVIERMRAQGIEPQLARPKVAQVQPLQNQGE